MSLVRYGLIVGFVLWAAATALFVPLGHFVFGPDNQLPVALTSGLIIVATFLGVYWLANRVLRRMHPSGLEHAALLGVFLCLPGLTLDGALYALDAGRYPGLDGTASGAMCAGLLLAYAAALLGTLVAGRAVMKGTNVAA